MDLTCLMRAEDETNTKVSSSSLTAARLLFSGLPPPQKHRHALRIALHRSPDTKKALETLILLSSNRSDPRASLDHPTTRDP